MWRDYIFLMRAMLPSSPRMDDFYFWNIGLGVSPVTPSCHEWLRFFHYMRVSSSSMSACGGREVDVGRVVTYDKSLVSAYFIFSDSSVVCKLKKALYGLKQASCAWNQTLGEVLQQLGFTASAADSCLYISKTT